VIVDAFDTVILGCFNNLPTRTLNRDGKIVGLCKKTSTFATELLLRNLQSYEQE
jgi:hypothetical protein